MTTIIDGRSTTTTSAWTEAMRWSAAAGIVEALLLTFYVERSFTPAAIIGVLFAVGLALSRRRSGAWVLTIAFALALIAEFPLTAPQLTAPTSFGSFAFNWAAGLTSAAGLVAGIAVLRRSARATSARPVMLVAAALTALAIVVGAAASIGRSSPRLQAGDIVVTAHMSTYHPVSLTIPQGPVTLFLNNSDNTLHDFHVTGHDIDKDIPANHQVRLTVNLPPGTYQYHCDLHDNMKGTITVR